MRDARLCTLQWAVGALCAATGALIFIAPHQFSAPIYGTLQPALLWWGAIFLSAGFVLLGVVAFSTRRWLVIIAHLLGATALLGMATSLFRAGALVGGVNYAVLGLGMLAALALEAVPPAPEQDALAALVGVASVATGTLLVLAPGLFGASIYDAGRPYLPWCGAGLLLGGLALLASQRRGCSRRWHIGACLLTGAACLAFLALVALPSRAWAGIAYFGGIGLMIALLPWLGPVLRRIDPLSLRTRLVYSLTAAAALPLILTMALVTQQQEQIASAQAEALQQTLATVLAQNVGDFIGLHQAGVVGLATQPGLLAMTPDEQRRLLRARSLAYAEATTFSLFDADGRGLARSDGQPLNSFAGNATFESFRRANQSGIHVLVDRQSQRPVIGLMEPAPGPAGEFAGLMIGVIDPAHIARLFAKTSASTGAMVHLVDERGRALAHAGDGEMPLLTDLTTIPPVRALLAGAARPGTLRYEIGAEDRLAGYAPVNGLGWGVVVEQPAAAALASVKAGRELTFLLLAAIVGGAAVVGWVAAGWLARPLGTLARAVEQLSAGNPDAPLPRRGLTEVQRLARGFGDLRDRLAARTAERERAEARLRFVADASRQLAGSLDYTETLGSVARQAVPYLADFTIVDLVDEQGRARRVATAHADPTRAALVAELRRYPPDLTPDAARGIGRVIRAGASDLRPVITDDYLAEIALDADHLAILRALAPTTRIVVPLVARQRTLGALSFARTGSARPYDENDLALAEELARRAALAIDNAGLYREAQEAVRLREEFLSIASHELRTPLTTVKGYVQYLARRLHRASDGGAALAPIGDQLAGQVARLEELVDDLLDVSRIQQGRLDLRPEPVDLAELAREVTARFAQAPELTEQHRLRLEAPDTLLGRWDANRLDQVLTNLLSNAIKYSPEGGEVVVSVRRNADEAEIVVSDQGIGITPAEQATLFHPFARGEAVRRRFAGTGLGLYIAVRIVEHHGGVLTVESEPGVGSRFTARLPLEAPVAAAEPGVAPTSDTPTDGAGGESQAP